MHRMANLRDSAYRSALFAFCLALGLSQGCSHSGSLHPVDASAPSSKQHLPFHPDVQPVSTRGPAISPDPKGTGGLPFPSMPRARVLPSGTLLTVELEASLAATHVRAGDAFKASVAAPLVVEGDTLIERGAEVTGRIESAQSRPGSGYVRMTLTAITVDGRPFAVQTSSLFARGAASRGNPANQQLGGVRVPKGRRLTFRLTAPVSLNEPGPNEPGPADKSQSLATATK
jgi:hypothetical protein